MKHFLGVSLGWIIRKLRTHFIAGILAVVPIAATIWIFVWLFNWIDGFLQPLITQIFGRPIPGIGFGITLVLIYLIGVIVSNFVGRRLIRYGESILAKIPLAWQLYNGIKQIMESFSAPGKTGFMQVVLVEFPRKGMRTIGFITNESYDKSGERLLNVFIPTAPNPTSGFLQIAREEEIIRTDISVEEALRMVVSAGRVSIKEVGDKLSMSDQT